MESLYKKWEWDLSSSPEDLWPLVANTDLFNFDLGLPPREDVTGNAPLQNARQIVRFSRYGLIDVEFQQEPFEWVRPHRYGFVRLFSKGPLTEIKVLATLNKRENGGTYLIYEVWPKPRNLIGKWMIQIDLNYISGSKLTEVFEAYDKEAAEWKGVRELFTPHELSPGGESRLQELSTELRRLTNEEDIVAKLVTFIKTADQISLAEMRPYVLADYWGVGRDKVLRLCLYATRIGLLRLQWNLLCPSCRGAKAQHESLSTIVNDVHCGVCNIDYTVNFDQSVEIVFSPAAAIRDVGKNYDFCISGPYETPHIVAQQLLQPGEERTIKPSFEVGQHRVRTLLIGGARTFRIVNRGEKNSLPISASADEWQPATLSKNSELQLINDTDEEQLFIIERTAWADQAVTAAEVTNLQTFRDLFSEEALRPGERISVGSLAILFTDLQASTTLYNSLGDAPAFGVVMNHFDVLEEATREHNGAIIKTIGDAIMATFLRPINALKVALATQQNLVEGDPSLVLKVGIHQGACIAVNLNERLDYFGSTVNIAARLESISTGQEIIISDAVYNDPEVRDFIANNPSVSTQATTVTLKGFDEPFKVWMISAVTAGSAS